MLLLNWKFLIFFTASLKERYTMHVNKNRNLKKCVNCSWNIHCEFLQRMQYMYIERQAFSEICQVKKNVTMTLFTTAWTLFSVFISLKYISISRSSQVVHWREWRLVTYLLSFRDSDFVKKCRTKALVIFKVSLVHWWMWCLYTITWNVCLLNAF